MAKSADPLRNLTFGALVEGEGLLSKSPILLQSAEPTKTIDISVFPLTAQTATAKDWIEKVETQALDYKSKSEKSVLAAHIDWWNQFWDRSWIYVNSRSRRMPFSLEGDMFFRIGSRMRRSGEYAHPL